MFSRSVLVTKVSRPGIKLSGVSVSKTTMDTNIFVCHLCLSKGVQLPCCRNALSQPRCWDVLSQESVYVVLVPSVGVNAFGGFFEFLNAEVSIICPIH